MDAYIKGVIVIGGVCSILTMALPHEDGGTGKYVKYISQLATLLVIIAPLSGILNFAGGFPIKVPTEQDLQTEAHTSVISKTAENVSKFITEQCAEKFGIDPVNIKVRLILDESDTENVLIEEIQLFTDERRSEEKERIKKYFEELFMTKVFVFGP